MIEFKVGDNAVYPGYGVGEVVSIESKEISGTTLVFYSIRLLESGLKVMVPMSNAKAVGLRPIISSKEAADVITILKDRDVKVDTQTWNRRYREYSEKIRTGSVKEIAEVLRDLYVMKDDKELSFSERKVLDQARGLLLKELTLTKTEDELRAEGDDVAEIFGLA